MTIESDRNSEPNDNLFHHIYKKRRSTNENELELFLGYPVLSAEINILEWWKLNEPQYPYLAVIARDYLTIPATSVPVERAFSSGTDLVTQKRCSLSAETI
ncbi:unnamed protein product [Rhizophagus irregularis]|nr:unnamed protein product [Rhizophagus irregularis]